MRALLLVSVLLAAATAQTWQVLAKDYETIMIGVSFVNNTHGWIPGDDNGAGAKFIRTQDGGKTWTVCPHDGYVTIPMGIAMENTVSGTVSGVISGVGIGRQFPGMEYTSDGLTFHAPDTYTDLAAESQDAKRIMGVDNAFALAGLFTDNKGQNYNGFAGSWDGGHTWSNYDTGILYPYARYGHFPDPNTWYIALGAWPELLAWDETPETRVLSQKLRIHSSKGVQYRHQVVAQDTPVITRPNRALLQVDTYYATIAKTSDAGKTWQTVYNNTGNFYFNDIDCPTTTDCWAVGESESDSPQPGVRIIHTADGGASWDVQLYVNDPTYSLMDIAFVNVTEGWAVGGILSSRNFSGEFFHTVDGGKHWVSAQLLSDEYATALSFYQATQAGSYQGWATALTREGQSSILGYF